MDELERIPLCDITVFLGRTQKMKPSEKRKLRPRTPKVKKVEVDDQDSDFQDEDSEVDEQRNSSIRKKTPKKLFDDDPKDDDYSLTGEESENDEQMQTRKKTRKKLFDDDPKDEDYGLTDEDSEAEEISKKKSDYSTHKKGGKISKEKSDYHTCNKDEDLSEYEKMVLRNKEEQRAFIELLKINEVKEEFAEAVQSLKAKPKTIKPIKNIKRSPPRSPVQLRNSRRLTKADLSLSEEAVAARAVAEAAGEEQKKLPSVFPFKDALQDNEENINFSKEFRNMDQAVVEHCVDYVSHFQSMLDLRVAKVVPDRITALAVHPTRDRALVCAGSKYGKIGFWNVDSAPFAFEPHSESITHLQFNRDRPQQLVSSSYDGTIRCGDVVKQVFSEVYNISEATSCLHFDFLSPHTLLVARRDGNVSVVDYRDRIRTSSKTHKCHDHPVKSISVHPLNKSYFLSADNRGTLCLWDLRKLQSVPAVEVRHHARCVQAAYFSPLTGNSVLTTSSDDTLCLFDSSNLGNSLTLKHSLKHNNHTGRWLTPFRGQWLPTRDDAFAVGSLAHPRRIQVYNDQMKNVFNFEHEDLNCITSLNVFHPSLPVLAGGNASGKVYVFADRDE